MFFLAFIAMILYNKSELFLGVENHADWQDGLNAKSIMRYTNKETWYTDAYGGIYEKEY